MRSRNLIINCHQGIRNPCSFHPMSQSRIILSNSIIRQSYLVTRTLNKSMSPTPNSTGGSNTLLIMQPALGLYRMSESRQRGSNSRIRARKILDSLGVPFITRVRQFQVCCISLQHRRKVKTRTYHWPFRTFSKEFKIVMKMACNPREASLTQIWGLWSHQTTCRHRGHRTTAGSKRWAKNIRNSTMPSQLGEILTEASKPSATRTSRMTPQLFRMRSTG